MNESRWQANANRKSSGHKLSEPRAKTRAPYDITYGNEPDMLDEPGLMVEPDARRKIAKYFKTMKLREVIEQMIDEMAERVPIHDKPVTFTFEKDDRGDGKTSLI